MTEQDQLMYHWYAVGFTRGRLDVKDGAYPPGNFALGVAAFLVGLEDGRNKATVPRPLAGVREQAQKLAS